MNQINKNETKQYKSWNHMMGRCYSIKYKEKHPTYKDCSVCEEWHNFQNFAKWFEENYYEIAGERMALDKDILVKGNKIYSPETCVFVPQQINKLITKRERDRGEFPLGVKYKTINRNYEARCNNGEGKSTYLGVYDTPQEAFYVYKERIIKYIADKYMELIPDKLYLALYNYKIEIND